MVMKTKRKRFLFDHETYFGLHSTFTNLGLAQGEEVGWYQLRHIEYSNPERTTQGGANGYLAFP